MQSMTLEEKIGQLLVVGFEGTSAPAYLLEWLAAGRVGGVILFQRNVENPQQLALLTESLHAASKYPLLISIDQEGGTVARLREGFTESPGAMALAASGDPQLAREVSAMLGAEMHALGINWVYAPVVDVTHSIENPSVGTRSIGKDPHTVARFVREQVLGFQSAGVAATAKHFPGLGNTPIDTHVALAVIEAPLDALLQTDLVPFREVIDAGVASVMLTHVKFPAIDPQHPATFAPAIATDLLRNRMGFRGVVTTDCLEMKAITNHYGAGESAVLTVLAGVDLALFSHTPDLQREAFDALLAAANTGRLPLARINEAVDRIQAFKALYPARTNPIPSLIQLPAHLELATRAARAGLVSVRTSDGVLPLSASARVSLVEFSMAVLSGIMETATPSDLARRMAERFNVTQHALIASQVGVQDDATLDGLCDADVLVIATRSAHLQSAQLATVRALLARAPHAIVLCLRNPYDAQVIDASTLFCTLGDSTPSLQAAVDLLAGEFSPSGTPTWA